MEMVISNQSCNILRIIQLSRLLRHGTYVMDLHWREVDDKKKRNQAFAIASKLLLKSSQEIRAEYQLGS